MKKVIRLTESDLMKIVKRVIKEESESYTPNDYLLVLGYLHQHGDEMKKHHEEKWPKMGMNFIQSRKNVMIYCEYKRDGKQVLPLKNPLDRTIFATALKLGNQSKTKEYYIQLGKNFKPQRTEY